MNILFVGGRDSKYNGIKGEDIVKYYPECTKITFTHTSGFTEDVRGMSYDKIYLDEFVDSHLNTYKE